MLPTALGNLPNFEELDLSDNRLSGSIPSALGNLHRLNTLFLRGNDFTGCVPARLRDVANTDFHTEGFDLESCQ